MDEGNTLKVWIHVGLTFRVGRSNYELSSLGVVIPTKNNLILKDYRENPQDYRKALGVEIWSLASSFGGFI